MKLHREGTRIILTAIVILVLLNILLDTLLPSAFLLWLFLSLVILGLVVQFFRVPNRKLPELSDGLIYAPADGKVVVIEEVEEPEYFQGKRIQISIFMSPLNVHINWASIGGIVKYYKYHPGKYLVAWHPKSSTENERSTIVIENEKGSVLIRQIAGAVARRLCTYVEEGKSINQGAEMGFIKFGSRLDVLLPLDAEINVEIGQKVKGTQDVLARW